MIIQTEAQLIAWQHAWANYHVLLAAAQLGLFDLLGDGQPRTAEMLAEQLAADARAIDICGRILVRAGLLHLEDGLFRLTQTAHDLREPIRDLKWEWRRRYNYADLLETIRSGRPAMATSGGVIEEDEADARQFLGSLYRRSGPSAAEAVKVVRQTWTGTAASAERGPRILDLGGGHGRYSATFAAELPGAQVTMFDRELVTRIAPELSGTAYATRSGDFLRDDLGGPYDIVFLAYIVSGMAVEDDQQLFRRIHAVLSPGGAAVVMDMFLDPSGMRPGSAIDFNLILLLENERGRFRTVEQVVTMLTEARFPTHRHIDVSGEDYGFVVGIRSQ